MTKGSNHASEDVAPTCSSIKSSPLDFRAGRRTAHPSPNGWRILLTGLGTSLAVIIWVVLLLVEVLLANEFSFTSSALITSAPLGPVITIAGICALIVSVTVPIVLGLAAYHFSTDWLAASRTGGDNRPTPFQLGMLMNVLQTPNFATICGACTFVVGFGPASKAQSLRKPWILRSAVAVSFFYASLAGIGAISESWLSSTSEAVPFLQHIPYQGSFPMLTRQLNRTLCDSTDIQAPNYLHLCGMIKAGPDPYRQSLPEGLRTLNNASILNSVAFTDDQIGLIVPATATIPDNVDFTASTYGVHTTCQSITSQCINKTYTGPDTYLALNCASSTPFNFSMPTTATVASFGILNSSGHILESNTYNVNSNPFSFAAVLTSHAYTGREDEFVNNTGFFVHGQMGAWNVLLCSVHVVSASYRRYTNGSFTTLTVTSENLNMTKRIATMVGTGYLTDRVPNVVEGTGLVSGNYVSSFALELSRELAAMSASIYEPGHTVSLVQFMPIIGTKLPLVPLGILFAVLLIYSLTILPITMLAVRGYRSTPYVALARQRLVDPFTVIYSAFDRVDVDRSWEESNTKLFSVASDEDRLNVGPMLIDDGDAVFGVSKKIPV